VYRAGGFLWPSFVHVAHIRTAHVVILAELRAEKDFASVRVHRLRLWMRSKQLAYLLLI
jgi:hypothetical protein